MAFTNKTTIAIKVKTIFKSKKANKYFGKIITLIYFIMFLSSPQILGQNYTCTVEGEVRVQSTGKPLENVNVFISGTIWGTTTDKSGFFRIESLPLGRHNVVASIVGYKTETVSVTLKEGMTLKVNFKLEEISYELNQVVITGKLPEEWKKLLNNFKNIFFGDSPFSAECEIVNPEVINLTRTNSGVLKADASRPIIIINKALGYKIHYDLMSFNWNEKKQTLQYLADSFFTELKDTTGVLEKKWEKNRKDAYYGSLSNFMRSLINNSFTEEGFHIYNDKVPSPAGASWFEIRKPVISSIGNDSYELNFKGYLRIEYKGSNYKSTEISWIKLNYPNVVIDKFGYPFAPFAFEIYGDWAYSGIADLLPKYYNP